MILLYAVRTCAPTRYIFTRYSVSVPLPLLILLLYYHINTAGSAVPGESTGSVL